MIFGLHTPYETQEQINKLIWFTQYQVITCKFTINILIAKKLSLDLSEDNVLLFKLKFVSNFKVLA